MPAYLWDAERMGDHVHLPAAEFLCESSSPHCVAVMWSLSTPCLPRPDERSEHPSDLRQQNKTHATELWVLLPPPSFFVSFYAWWASAFVPGSHIYYSIHLIILKATNVIKHFYHVPCYELLALSPYRLFFTIQLFWETYYILYSQMKKIKAP